MPIITSINLRPHPHYTICLLLNSCSLLCHLLPTPLPLLLHPHYRALLAVAASLSSVYLLACGIATAHPAPEPPESALLRKKIQTENWRLMLNRVLYLAQMQAVLARRRGGKRGRAQVICRTHSAPNEEKKTKSRTDMRKWQSWSETSISDFHAGDCRNTDWPTEG
jgi:hypothetical protein